MKLTTLMVAAALLLTSVVAAAGDGGAVAVSQAWARATVPGQMATGAFMTLTASASTQLVGVASPVAGVAQLHVMKMDNGVMKMAPLQGGLELPAGKAVALRSGGYHIMLMDLKAPLKKGSTVSLTLIFKDEQGVQSKQEVTLPVAMVAPTGVAKVAAMGRSMDNMDGEKPAFK